MKVTILDIKTGDTWEQTGRTPYDYAEGNWACDCNRHPIGMETGLPDGVCEGQKRFVVVALEMTPQEQEEPGVWKYAPNCGYPDSALTAADRWMQKKKDKTP